MVRPERWHGIPSPARRVATLLGCEWMGRAGMTLIHMIGLGKGPKGIEISASCDNNGLDLSPLIVLPGKCERCDRNNTKVDRIALSHPFHEAQILTVLLSLLCAQPALLSYFPADPISTAVIIVVKTYLPSRSFPYYLHKSCLQYVPPQCRALQRPLPCIFPSHVPRKSDPTSARLFHTKLAICELRRAKPRQKTEANTHTFGIHRGEVFVKAVQFPKLLCLPKPESQKRAPRAQLRGEIERERESERQGERETKRQSLVFTPTKSQRPPSLVSFQTHESVKTHSSCLPTPPPLHSCYLYVHVSTLSRYRTTEPLQRRGKSRRPSSSALQSGVAVKLPVASLHCDRNRQVP